MYDYICLLINALNKNLLSACYVPDNLVGPENTITSKFYTIPNFTGLSL